MSGFKVNENDAALLDKLSNFIPKEIFDAHVHCYDKSKVPGYSSYFPALNDAAEVLDTEEYLKEMKKICGSADLSGQLIFGFPSVKCDIEAQNDFICGELNKNSDSYGLMLVSPQMESERLEEYVKKERIVGFKPYHLLAGVDNSQDLSVLEFCPQWVFNLADKHGLVITLHIVRDNGLSDSQNFADISAMCEKYPNATIILAHAGRGFNPDNTISSIGKYEKFQNIYFDCSGICESAATISILESFGPGKLLYGSDFPISHMKGKCVSSSNGFIWLREDNFDWQSVRPKVTPTFVGIESLLALKKACEALGLNGNDIASIFSNNAKRVLGIIPRDENRNQKLYDYAKTIIPGGSQLLSKRPEQFAPKVWPPYFKEAHGCEIVDIDGKHYYDFSISSVGTCLLGYNNKEVNDAVRRRITLGSISTLNCEDEVYLAERMLSLHPWADNVRFARSGGEAMAVAARIARATTDRSIIAICGYHGWQDWYLAANLGGDDNLTGHLLPGLNPHGVPAELYGTTIAFYYNNKQQIADIIDKYGDNLAAVIMEPCRNSDPDPDFLLFVREQTQKCGALLVFDEITIGWRLVLGGAHLKLAAIPDMAVYAKAMGNGYPISCIIGTRKAMEGAHISFISSSFWTEGIGYAAALETIRQMELNNIPPLLHKSGKSILKLWGNYKEKYNLPVKVFEDDYPCFAHFAFEGEHANELKTLFTQLMIEEGFLASCQVYVTLAHDDYTITKYAKAVDHVFSTLKTVIERDNYREVMRGEPAHCGFKRLV